MKTDRFSSEIIGDYEYESAVGTELEFALALALALALRNYRIHSKSLTSYQALENYLYPAHRICAKVRGDSGRISTRVETPQERQRRGGSRRALPNASPYGVQIPDHTPTITTHFYELKNLRT